MRYLLVFNGSRGYSKEEIVAKTWQEFLDILSRRVYHAQEPPDMIYLIEVGHK
jgi:hypothetical protein